MWCNNCQHGHEPILKTDPISGKSKGVCPCCGVILDASMQKTSEQLIIEFADKYGFEVTLKKKIIGEVIGKVEETPKSELKSEPKFNKSK